MALLPDLERLNILLAAGKWKQANLETGYILLKVAASNMEYGWLTSQDLEKFPCLALCQLDNLWVHYTQGRCGFSVQRKLYEELGKDFDKLAQRWRVKDWAIIFAQGFERNNYLVTQSWSGLISEDESPTFSHIGPRGYLPFVGYHNGGMYPLLARLDDDGWDVFFTRLHKCDCSNCVANPTN